jgi:hypothetical protein
MGFGYSERRWMLAMIAIPVAFLLFSTMRPVATTPNASLATPNAGSATAAAAAAAVYTLNSTEIQSACVIACGVGAVCVHSDTTGIVTNCTSCPRGHIAADGGAACLSLANQCMATPWCSTVEANGVQTAHLALVMAAVAYIQSINVSYIVLYPTGLAGVQLVTSSASWSVISRSLASANVTDASAIATNAVTLINEFLVGTIAALTAGNRANTTRWFDDQNGWWQKSLSLFTVSVPSQYALYINSIKLAVCTRTWQGSGASAESCTPPSMV